ncbi:MAG: UDP-N-acetylmuramate--L-alanine ligase [Lachnospiraceae bacterium]|nr:UDP-N-acetylmuramate--L-alanine ligase [Lachnospiraceae bacterium]
MYTVDFNKKGHIYFIGIGGVSMCSLAEVMIKKGFKVSGSDRELSANTDRLEKLGATIYQGQKAANISDDLIFAVRTAAVHPDNKEYIACEEKHIPILTRAEFFGQIMSDYKKVACVAGTHGKTTSSSMLALVLKEANLDPTAFIGGIVNEFGSTCRIGSTDMMVAEACEYTNSYHSFHPTDAVILNIEADHLDFFKDLDDIYDSFLTFAKLVPENGNVIINGDDERLNFFKENLKCDFFTFGIANDNKEENKYDLEARNLSEQGGIFSFDFYISDKFIAKAQKCASLSTLKKFMGRVTLGVLGKHNVSNALTALGLGMLYGAEFEAGKEALRKYHGTKRRFEYKGSVGSIHLYDDFGHHPTEIDVTIESGKKVTKGRCIIVFQPYTYTRTNALFDDFVKILSKADKCIICDTFPAREEKDLEIRTAEELNDAINEAGTESCYFNTKEEIVDYILTNSEPEDLLITMGCGDIHMVAEMLVGDISE